MTVYENIAFPLVEGRILRRADQECCDGRGTQIVH